MDAAVGPRSTRASGKTSLLAVVATGTSRDILPYIALARALQRSGFGVRLVTHQSLQRFVQSFGLPFLPLKGDPASLMRSTAFRDAIAGGSALAVSALLLREDTKGRELNFSALHAATKDVDGILCGISLLTECMAVAQKYGIPLILCPLLPYSPSGEVRNSLSSGDRNACPNAPVLSTHDRMPSLVRIDVAASVGDGAPRAL